MDMIYETYFFILPHMLACWIYQIISGGLSFWGTFGPLLWKNPKKIEKSDVNGHFAKKGPPHTNILDHFFVKFGHFSNFCWRFRWRTPINGRSKNQNLKKVVKIGHFERFWAHLGHLGGQKIKIKKLVSSHTISDPFSQKNWNLRSDALKPL